MKLRRLHLFAVPLMFILLAGAVVALIVMSRSGVKTRPDARAFPYQFEDVATAKITPMPFFVADVDLDGNDDLLINEPTRLLWYRLHDDSMAFVAEGSYERRGCTRMITDANGDGRPEFFVLQECPEGSMISCHDWFSPKGPSVPLYTIGPILPSMAEPGGRSSMRIHFLGRSTAGSGNHPRIFIGINSMRLDPGPRYLLSLDGATGQEQWRFCFGPKSMDLVCDDFGGSASRVVFSTIASLNRKSCNGTSDSTCYVFCLDERDGSLLWRREIAGASGWSRIALADANGDGQKEILLARHLRVDDPRFKSEPAPWIVAILSGENEILSSVALPDGAASILTMDLDGDSVPGMLVEQDDGNFVIFDHELKIKRILSPVSPRRPATEIFGVWDLVGRREPEIVCRMDSMFMVRDEKGNVLAERNFWQASDMQIARYDGKRRVVAASRHSIHVMSLERTPLMTRIRGRASRWTIAEFAAAALLAGVGGFHIRRYLKRRGEKQFTLDEAQNDLLTAMAAYGHGGSSLKVVDRIRLHLKNWDRVQSGAGAREELFAKLYATFMETVVPELKHIVMLAHKAGVPEEIWGTIVSRARLAGHEMEAILTVDSEDPAAGREEHIAEALMTLGDVDESLARIRLHLRSVFRAAAAEALERAVARFRDEHGGTKVSFASPSGASAAEGVFISPVAFDKILEGLLANSARAAEGRTDAEIAIEARWEGNYCTIEIRDNGCGIPREDWKRVFDRSYTTKEEGGFGLYYAHETLARFNGKIFVLDSVVGSGTTMRIVLRKS